MSKRYGRNQRRAARARIAELEADFSQVIRENYAIKQELKAANNTGHLDTIKINWIE